MTPPDLATELDRAAALVAAAHRIVVLTGAGISHESGVPTFRGPGGLWREHRPEELATPEAFANDPRLVWSWYGWRAGLVAACEPNAAHLALARLAAARAGDVRIVTQNVDGLHDRAADALSAGTATAARAAACPLELHGSLLRRRCTRCGWHATVPDPADARTVEDGGALPACHACGALARPDVVWFGETLDPAVLDAAWSATERADLCLVVGTSALVHPAASLPAAARRAGAAVIEVNPEPTPVTPLATVSLRCTATVGVPELVGV